MYQASCVHSVVACGEIIIKKNKKIIFQNKSQII